MSTNPPESTEIHFYDTELAKRHPEMLAAVTRRAMEFVGSSIRVIPAERRMNGWLEWSLLVRYLTGNELFIAAIQRRPDAEIEFCS
ncbi:hypothetical protein RQP54_18195 [Curvibacter sp. APW13]|uniref:hypothetical protein n=1 Tax=Curvibacter sp. APW13 TaxID=3077236 RepID=UPI0028DDAEA3|nr:hypothetical protein [Curvibacter sp. APW13]MDT8992810.1 hypothetical protein [Curvibacter sp. APW13]